MRDLHEGDWSGASVKIGEASSLTPFEYGLEYGTPARGMWNIVHIGMLVPESHQIYICAQGCLRGVVLTAAEMGAMDRFSTIAVCENNVLEGDMAELIIDGVADIISKLPNRPRVIEIFTACIHHFMGTDLGYVYRELRTRFPDIYFDECWMDPIMRKTKVAPDPMTRMRLYSFIKRTENIDRRAVNFIGSNYRTQSSGDLSRMLRAADFEIREITRCETFEEYEKMGDSLLNIGYMPFSVNALRDLKTRLGMDYLYLPVSYDAEEVNDGVARLAEKLEIKPIDTAMLREEAERALAQASRLVGGRPVAVDYTVTPRPLGLALLLLEMGFNVRTVYGDAFLPEERPAFDRLREKYPELELCATVHPKMDVLPRREHDGSEEIIALGQKAAYFSNTEHFVNELEGGGYWGFDGWLHMAEEICNAVIEEKDTRRLIQIKGWGCGCLL